MFFRLSFPLFALATAIASEDNKKPCVLALIATSAHDRAIPREIPQSLLNELTLLAEKTKKEESLRHVYEKLQTILSQQSPLTPFVKRLLSKENTNEKQILKDFLSYAIYRKALEKEASEIEKAAQRAVHPAFETINIDIMLDRIILRLLDSESPIPDETAKALHNLFQGGAKRIQFRANGFWLIAEQRKLSETEKLLKDGVVISDLDLFEGIKKLNELDGASSMGFQAPRASEPPSKQSLSLKERTETNAIALSSHSLSAATHLGIINSTEVNTLVSIGEQSPATTEAILKIENKIKSLAPNSPEALSSSDVYRAYLRTLIYNSHKAWQHKGTLDELAQLVVLHGSEEHKKDFIAFIQGEEESITNKMQQLRFIDPQTYLKVFLQLSNLIKSKPIPDSKTLDFIFTELHRLRDVSNPARFERGEETLIDIRLLRMKNISAPDSFHDSLKKAGVYESNIGPYKIKYEVSFSKDSPPRTTLSIDALNTELHEDTEYLSTISAIEDYAHRAKINIIQLRNSGNYHYEGALQRALGYKKEMPPHTSRSDPIFTKHFLENTFEWNALEQQLNGGDFARGSAKVGHFTISFRLSPFSTSVNGAFKKIFTITTIDSSKPGTKQYPILLVELESLLSRKGFDLLLVEGVSLENQKNFYLRNGFTKAEKSDDKLPSFYRVIKEQ